MGNKQRSLAIAVIASGAALVLGACGAAPSETPTASTPTSAVSSTHAATRHAAAPTRTHAATHPAPKTSAASGKVADVACGPITAANGQKLRVVAKGSAAGVAGCTEAINVLTEYFQRGGEGQGTAHELTVAGWRCSTIDNGVTKEVLTGCEKDGLSIAAENG